MKLLLHICCGPCALYPLDVLAKEGISPVGYFFNPNIHPFREYERRVNALREVAGSHGLKMIWDSRGYDLDAWLYRVGQDIKPPARCSSCYGIRLDSAARLCAEQGMDAFTTTLLYSRYQRHQEIRRVGEECAERYGVKFLYRDFRQGWQQGIDMAIEAGIYRQPYCGCIFSERERYASREKRLASSLEADGDVEVARA